MLSQAVIEYINKQPEELRLSLYKKALQEYYKNDLMAYAKNILGYKQINAKTHGEIITALERGSRRKVICFPRGGFKCYSPKTMIYDKNGRPLKIEDVLPGEKILSYKNGKSVESRVVAKELALNRRMYRIHLRSGRITEASNNHPFLSINGWVFAEDLQIKDRIAGWSGKPMEFGERAPKGHPWLLGMMIGDGCCKRSSLVLYHKDLRDKTLSEINKAGINASLMKSKNHKNTYNLSKGIKQFLVSYGIKESLSKSKKIPDQVWNWSLEDRRSFIAAYISCDGHTNKAGKTILTTASRELCYGFVELLKTIGVFSVIRYYEYDYKTTSPRFYSIRIVDNISQRNLIKCPLIMKKRPVAVSPQDGFYRSVPKAWRRRGMPKAGRGSNPSIRVDNDYDTSFTKFRKFAKELGVEWACSDEVYWDQVVKIEEFTGPAIDISIEDTHTFIADGLISHNSSIATIAYPMWCLERNPNDRILIDSEIYTNSKNFLREIKGHYQSESYINVFGSRMSDKWTESEIIVSSRTKVQKEASITVGSIGTEKTGQHYLRIISDDLNSKDNSDTREKAQKVIQHFQYNLNILEPGGEYVIIGTRYSENDLIGWILREQLNLKSLSEGKMER